MRQYKNTITNNFVNVDDTRDDLLTPFSKERLKGGYMLENESYQDVFARVATTYGDCPVHAQRLYDYMSKFWFMPATPILSNGGAGRGLPISCFLNEVQDSLDSIFYTFMESGWLSAKGGGIGTYWGNLRSIGEKVKHSGVTSGPIPFLKVQEAMSLAVGQGSLRRGSSAAYMPVWHPEIEEFLAIRKPTGGDLNRKMLEIHHAVVLDDTFMEAVEAGEMYALRSPKTHEVVSKVPARDLWAKILTTRIETGEPYIIFIDNVSRDIPKHHKMLGLDVKMSNLCSEILLPTGEDYLNNERTAVCCLSSVNMETWDEWRNDKYFIEDIYRFLDNVLQDFIDNAPEPMKRARYSAMRERSVGLGVMGFQGYLQSKMIPMDSVSALAYNKEFFSELRMKAIAASRKLAKERGNCPDYDVARLMNGGESLPDYRRFSYVLAIAPTASISIIAGEASPCIEPRAANVYKHNVKNGTFTVRNKYLERVLESNGENTEDTWQQIIKDGGSVRNLVFLTDWQKSVFATASEIDQSWLVKLAADRSTYIDQGQSLNLFVHPEISKRKLHDIHFDAWKGGVKTLYYLRSDSVGKGEYTGGPVKSEELDIRRRDYEECVACQ